MLGAPAAATSQGRPTCRATQAPHLCAFCQSTAQGAAAHSVCIDQTSSSTRSRAILPLEAAGRPYHRHQRSRPSPCPWPRLWQPGPRQPGQPSWPLHPRSASNPADYPAPPGRKVASAAAAEAAVAGAHGSAVALPTAPERARSARCKAVASTASDRAGCDKRRLRSFCKPSRKPAALRPSYAS